ncbi:major tail tube protein [Asticcacaulis sp. AC460]|uniref:phage major tail tube protein n=1 Tax=Asticcacaulis sp. AC460 TaxID=1282360 RepID=UPI0003C3ED43|nr:phage major tail tube protein [Asticcacaulis sp. AC460]ESQ89984.1 major tail tube protein [Asticcacaulis sp. AC460]
MSLPKKLKNFNVHGNGESYLGQVAEVTIPKIVRKMEGFRGAGMDSEARIDMGGEPMDFEWKPGGLMVPVLRQIGLPSLTGVQLRFSGAYQDDSSGTWTQAEILVTGRHEEVDMGTAKGGDNNEWSVKTNVAYYRLSVNGVVEIEYGLLPPIFVVGGVDRLKEMREALGIGGGPSFTFGVSL